MNIELTNAEAVFLRGLLKPHDEFYSAIAATGNMSDINKNRWAKIRQLEEKLSKQ